jgi:large subunit ribosomal protein L18e
VWRALARGLNRPGRGGFRVNLYRIEKHAKGKETIAVPGIVLGSGEVSRARDVAALRFSESARAKLEKAGGKCLTIRQLLEQNPGGKGVRIMG